MPASFQEILNSRSVKFIVGEDIDSILAEFLVHEAAITALSEPLRNLLTADFSESRSGCVSWPHVSKETFERFVQFAYTGDYTIPSPIPSTVFKKPVIGSIGVVHTHKDDVKENHENLDESYDDFFRSIKTKKKKAKVTKADIWSDPPAEEEGSGQQTIFSGSPLPRTPNKLIGLSYQLSAPRNNHEDSCEPPKELKKGSSYSNVFLCHASLFVLADYHLINPLKDLALFKLHKTLCMFELDGDNTADIIDLARYAYLEEGRGSESGVGSLRSLVCQFMADNAHVLSSDTGFMALLSEGGELSADVFKFTVQQLPL